MKISALVSSVALEVLGCPRPVIERKLRQAADEFFRETGVWRASVEFTIPAGEDRHDLSTEISSGSFALVASAEASPGPVRYAVEDTWFVLSGPAGGDVTVKAVLVLVPGPTDAEIPDAVLGPWAPVLEDGALAGLYAQRQPWGNGALSLRSDALFRKGKGRARGAVDVQGAPVRREAYGRRLD